MLKAKGEMKNSKWVGDREGRTSEVKGGGGGRRGGDRAGTVGEQRQGLGSRTAGMRMACPKGWRREDVLAEVKGKH